VYVLGLVDAGRGVQVSGRSGAGPSPGRLRAAELIGALSLATDFGVGEPLEHGLRTTVIGVRLAESLGLGEEDRRAVYYVALLRYAGCTAESHLDAALFGDEIAVRAAMAPVLFGSRAELFLAIARTMHAGEPARWRAVAIARALAQLRNTFRKGAAGHCEVTQAHALHLGLGTEIQAALGDVFERWDGNGWPGGRKGEQVPLPVRLMQVAEDADLQHGLGGLEQAVSVVRKRAGAAFDPAVADAFCRAAPELLDGLDGAALWESAMAAEPGEPAMLDGEQVDEGLRVIGDFADLTIRRDLFGRLRARTPSSQPDREHRPAEQRDNHEDGEREPSQPVAVGREIDDTDDQPARREQEVAQDQRRPDAIPSTRLLGHAAARKPDREQNKTAARRQNPRDQCRPFHLRLSPLRPANDQRKQCRLRHALPLDSESENEGPPAGSSSAAAARRTSNVVPTPCVDSTMIEPPIAVTSERAIASPRAEPSGANARSLPPR